MHIEEVAPEQPSAIHYHSHTEAAATTGQDLAPTTSSFPPP
jgi:hypothetical protein